MDAKRKEEDQYDGLNFYDLRGYQSPPGASGNLLDSNMNTGNPGHTSYASNPETPAFSLDTPNSYNMLDVPSNFEVPVFNIDNQFTGQNDTTSEFLNHSQSHFDTLAPPEAYSRTSSFAGSVYSDVSSNANSPFHDAMSQFSGFDHPPSHPHQSFQNEIQLGGSISNTNLVSLSEQITNDPILLMGNQDDDTKLTQGNLERFQDHQFGGNLLVNNQPSLNIQGYNPNPHPNSNINPNPNPHPNPNKYTDATIQSQFASNDFSLSSQQQHPQSSALDLGYKNDYSGVTISIDAAPELAARKTPSLFSNSSHSSLNNSPQPSHGTTGQANLSPGNQIPGSSPGSLSDYSESLRPEEYSLMKRGRKSAHTRQRSRSKTRSSISDNDEEEFGGELNASREKMIELASPNQVAKRTQKHPSIYACNLCDKRFTRPYNLKSHLRTHTDERPFICNVCGKAFARQHDRKRHEDLHTGEKKYQCKGTLKNGQPYGCGRKFARADALRRHFQTETGKECIRLLLEEDEKGSDQLFNRDNLTSPEIPIVAISPPDS